MVTSPGSPEHLASNPARILRASKSVSGPNSLYVGGKIQVIFINKLYRSNVEFFQTICLIFFRSNWVLTHNH